MRTNPYQSYLENEILTADPLKLVVLLYRGALDSIGSARRHLAAKDIAARSRSITKAMEILAELVRSLDYERGGDVSKELARLYDYVLAMLVEGNAKQVDKPLADAERVLSVLVEGWQAAYDREQEPAPVPVVSSARSRFAEQEEEPEYRRVSYAY